VSSVIDTLECPSISDTIFGWTPCVSRMVAQVRQRSWNLAPGSLARARSGSKVRLRSLLTGKLRV
jgi:hypothetical protein